VERSGIERSFIVINYVIMKVLSISNPEEEKILRSSSRIVTDRDFANDNVKNIIQQLRDTLTYYGNGV
jgi:hypothetical protein